MNVVSTEHKGFIPYTNHVVGTVGDADKARSAIDALLQAGFHEQDIDILHDEEDLKRLDPKGAAHGFVAQFQRTLIRAFELEQFKHLTHHREDVRAGRYVIMVLAKRRVQRSVAADILNRYGAEFVGFHGRWALEDLPARHTAPEDTPAFFARAWNNRNADALAALFDEDAQFVSVTGLACHDRESIRKAHASELKHIADTSTLVVDDTQVKLLSPDIAVVHARMTLSGPVPRTTIATFVVHRTVDRWLCASAQTTDVVPNTETHVIDEAGVYGLVNNPSGQVS